MALGCQANNTTKPALRNRSVLPLSLSVTSFKNSSSNFCRDLFFSVPHLSLLFKESTFIIVTNPMSLMNKCLYTLVSSNSKSNPISWNCDDKFLVLLLGGELSKNYENRNVSHLIQILSALQKHSNGNYCRNSKKNEKPKTNVFIKKRGEGTALCKKSLVLGHEEIAYIHIEMAYIHTERTMIELAKARNNGFRRWKRIDMGLDVTWFVLGLLVSRKQAHIGTYKQI